MQRLFRKDSPHIRDSTKLGWTVWIVIVASIWILAFIIASVIPFFSELYVSRTLCNIAFGCELIAANAWRRTQARGWCPSILPCDRHSTG